MFRFAARVFRPRRRDSSATPVYPEQFAPAMDLAPFAGTPKIYLIATTPRCGSHFLGHALAGAGAFGVPLEYLNAGNLPSWTARFGPDDLPAILRHLVAHRTSPSGLFGLKAHWSQFAPHADRALFAPFGGIERAIFIHRRDLLGQAISYLRAARTGQFIAGADRRQAAEYDYRRIVGRAENIRAQNLAWAAYFRDAFDRPVMNVVYEGLLADQPGVFAAVGAFLDPDAPVIPVASARTQRQSDGASDEWRARFLRDQRPEHRWLAEPQAW